MKTFELRKEYANKIINITAKELIDNVGETVSELLDFFPTTVREMLVIDIVAPIFKKYLPEEKKEGVEKEKKEKFDKAVDEGLDQILKIMEDILKIERGN